MMESWHPIEIKPIHDGPYLVFMPKRTLDRFAVQHWDRTEDSFSNDFGITHWRDLPAEPTVFAVTNG